MASASSTRVDLVLQYSLLVAGEQDTSFDRQLGPIHLLKYVYLADLFAGKNEGATYTGIEWKFYKFGPWSQSVNERIAPALSACHFRVIMRKSRSGFAGICVMNIC